MTARQNGALRFLGPLLGGALLAATACGGKGRDPLEGVWGVGEDIDQACIVEYVFDSDGAAQQFRETTYCRLTTGGVGVEAHEGDYSYEKAGVHLTITRSTCPDLAEREATFAYSIARDRLTLSTPEASFGLARRRAQAVVTGATANGCFDAQDRFTPSPLRDL